MQLLLFLLALSGAALSLAGLAFGIRWLALAGAAVAIGATAIQYFVGVERSADAMASAVATEGDDKLAGPAVAAAARRARREHLVPLGLAVATALVYFFSNPRPQNYFDYTFRIAGALLGGRTGLTEQPPSWLNEMVPHGGRFYSVFPLGSVLSLLPVALLKAAGLVETYPAAFVAAVVAGATSLLLYLVSLRYDLTPGKRLLLVALLKAAGFVGTYPAAFVAALVAGATSLLLHLVSLRYDLTPGKRLLLVAFVSFGTWAWCNLSYGGAWQIALGLAVVGQLGALYYTLVKPRPFSAGLFFALAFGNRTEIILLAPVFMYLACRDSIKSPREIVACRPTLVKFSAVPLLLGTATLAYNYSRFGSPFDFGYARIPGVLSEPWYRDGLFSLSAVPRNVRAMLFETWRVRDGYPYLVPGPFGGSIFLASPLLLLLFRRGARDRELKRLAWIAIALVTVVLWLHGNPGGWQFSYRYAMILLPWMFLILLESGPRYATKTETALAAASVAVNAYATYLFHWTDHVQP